MSCTVVRVVLSLLIFVIYSIFFAIGFQSYFSIFTFDFTFEFDFDVDILCVCYFYWPSSEG